MANQVVLQRLIAHVVDQVRDAGGSLTKTKLVKLLYLIDLEYYRVHNHTLTKTDWRFWLYGPYASDVDEALRRMTGVEIEETAVITRSGRMAFSYAGAIESTLDDLLPLSDRQTVFNVLRRWAEEELDSILDYVYFDTAPMKGAKFGDWLDFSRVRPRVTHDVRRDLERVSEEGRHKIAQLRVRHKDAVHRRVQEIQSAHVMPPRYDNVFISAVRLMASEEDVDLSSWVGKPIELTPAARESLSEQS